MGPDVDRLVGHLEAAEDAVQRRALRVPVPRDDAVLSEHLGEEEGGGVQFFLFIKPQAETRHILQPFKILEYFLFSMCYFLNRCHQHNLTAWAIYFIKTD